MNRSEMKVSFVEPGETQNIGKITDPYDMCSYIFYVWNENNVCDYLIEANCCQCYFWCKCPCEECALCLFEIKDYRNGQILENIYRRGSLDCCNNVNSNQGDEMNRMDVFFPNNSNWKQRALLMCTGVFLDYVYFEETQSSQDIR